MTTPEPVPPQRSHPRPSVGRIVIYHDRGGSFAAIVTAVYPDAHVIDCTVFYPERAVSPKPTVRALTKVPERVPIAGEGAGWSWPVHL